MMFSTSALFGGQSETLAVGDAAPGFSLQGTDGALYEMDHYRGKQPLVLAWFPRAATPG
jgi:peroxiredoxin Q/BCP